MNAKQFKELVEELFKKRSSLMLLWQEIAENFYPERADFTITRTIGTDFAGNLTTSYPLLARRDLGDQIGAMLRPTTKLWHHMSVPDLRREDNEAKRYLEWANDTMRRAMYDTVTKFTRATKEADHDWSAFGQAVISIELNSKASSLLYRCWHLRDVVWQENADGSICMVARKWKPGVRQLCLLFPGKCHEKVQKLAEKKPFEELNLLHIVCDADMYDGHNSKARWSVYYDCDNDHVIEATPIEGRIYIIPRWQTVSGGQYAFSPATIAALPEARLVQAMAYTLLEAGEKIVNPPLVATQDVIKSDVAIFAGGVTWVDADYDERLGDALRPLNTDSRGMPLSRDMQMDTRAILKECFYLNRLSLPRNEGDMTAYETAQRVQEYIRGALPLFEPMEAEYNGALCEETFQVLQRAGAFGSPFDVPRSLRGADIQFRFESPLHDAIERQKSTQWLEAKQIIADAVAVDQSAIAMIDAKTALRDVLDGIGVPAKWMRSEIEVSDIEAAQKAAIESQQTLAAMQQSSEVAANLGTAQKNIAKAEATV